MTNLIIVGCIDRNVYKAVEPVFCGPITRNFGNRSHDLVDDQMARCLLSLHGFYINI